MSAIIESTIEKIEHVPKTYLAIGAVSIAGLFLFVRSRNAQAQAQAQAQNNNASDGLMSAMQLPGGISYAPISSGGTGFAGGADISTVFGNAPKAGDLGASGPNTSQNSAAIVYDNNTDNTRRINAVPGQGTGIYLQNGQEVTHNDIAGYFDSKGGTNQAADLSYGRGIGMGDSDISRAEAIYNVDKSKSLYVNGDTLGKPVGASDADIIAFYNANSQDPLALHGAELRYGVTADRAAKVTGADISKFTIASNDDIINFYNANKNDPAALHTAMQKYGVTSEQVRALTGSSI